MLRGGDAQEPGHMERVPAMFEDFAVVFSAEEWRGLTAWQKDLYRTVMRDSAELFGSLGSMFRRQKLQQRDRAPPEVTAGETVAVPRYTRAIETAATEDVIEEIAGENFIIQVTGAPSFRERGGRSPHSARPPAPHSARPPAPRCTVKTESEESAEEEPERSSTWHAETPLIPQTGTPHGDSLRTGAGGFMTPGSGGDPMTRALFPDNDYLTIIQVEEIPAGLEKDERAPPREGWRVHADDSVVPWNNEAAFPLALLGPPDPSNYQYDWPEGQSHLGSGPVRVEGPPGTVEVQDTILGESLHQCSVCSKSFLSTVQLEHHERLHQKKAALECPACRKRFNGPRSLREHQRTHHSPDHGDPAKQTPKGFRCSECNRKFSRVAGLHRHQEIHTRTMHAPKPLAPPPKKVYRLPAIRPSPTAKNESRPEASGEAFTKLHRHLQLSTTFLQNLITSTGGFQYD